MNFISKEFAVLLVSVLIFLYLFKNPLARKLTVLSASCVFYAWWDWRFLGLLATVTLVDYYVSHFLFTAKSEKKRKILLWVSIVTNLGFLGVFKYFNFFTQTLDLLAQTWGWRVGTLNIILPIGISFYTFETLSYVIDVYRRVTLPAKSLLDYAIFITFFPRLVAGPIMRASQFLPQLERGIQLNFPGLVNGAQLFLRGMLKKMVIADNVAVMVDQVFQAPGVFSSPTVWLGVAAYSVQILYDFWGYTDMACGIGKMLGIELPINFNLPYTAQSISEFWTRWHISLSTWLRDYLYISLGGNRRGKVRTYLNLMITMLLGGLWHGASWNFVLWGGLHGLYLAVERMLLGPKIKQHSWHSPIAWARALLVFGLVTLTWVPFRSPNWQTTWIIYQKLFFMGSQYNIEWYYVWALIAIPLVIGGGCLARRFEWKWPILPIQKSYTPAVMLLEILIIFYFSPVASSPFIYFQF
jgi:alginate O-acetyltransferase complex protein AlgI